MRLHLGTSGFSYKEWKGTFYPADLPAAKMLEFYATQFPTVEINNTFYRMPNEATMRKWAGEAPDGFTFVFKAPMRITRIQQPNEEDIRAFFALAGEFGAKLGPVLFQPITIKDAGKLRDYVRLLPPGRRYAFEFRHDSWFDEEVYAVLRELDVALCLSDTDDVAKPDALVIPTASWGYLRLRRTNYSDRDLRAWVKRIRKQAWTDVYVFFKHEDEAKGPAFAKRFRALWTGRQDAAASAPR